MIEMSHDHPHDSVISNVLEQLGLNQYLNVFEEEGFDDGSFLLLTENDLKIMVPRIGHRRFILNAVIALRDNKVYICFLCRKFCSNLKTLLAHLKIVHRLGENSIYRCVHCNSSYNRRSYLRHFRNVLKVHNIVDRGEDDEQPVITAKPLNSPENDKNKKPYEESLLDCAAKSMASLLESGKVPISTTQTILLRAKQLIVRLVQDAKQIAINSLGSEDTPQNKLTSLNAIDELSDPFRNIDTRYKLEKYLSSGGFLIKPEEIVLDTDISFRQRGNSSVKVYKPVTMQYVPIKRAMKQLLEKEGFHSMLDNSKSNSSPYIYKSFRDGSFFHEREIPNDSIVIIIYYDDAEVANPLGSKTGMHKISNSYFSVLDLSKHCASSVDNIHLLATLKSADLKEFSANRIVQVILDELLELWNVGIDFTLNGEIRNVNVVLGQLAGDNLGLHGILGYSEGFTANRPCRRCRMHRDQCRTEITENVNEIRTIQNYRADLQLNKLSLTGIKFESVINRLPYHHTIDMVVFDIMHDIFEGVGPDLFKKLINHAIERKYLTPDKLNYRLESFNYGRHYIKSKPSLIKVSFLKGDATSGQSASQAICFSMCLPLLIGDLIPEGDEKWGLIHIYREIVDILLSPTLSRAGLIHLNMIISEYCLKIQTVFNDTLKPKHHHMLHYCRSIERIGPLRQFWCMTYEARHKYFKTVAHATCNFRNISKSLAYRFQMSKCFKLMSQADFSPCTFDAYRQEYIMVSEMRHMLEITQYFDTTQSDLIFVCQRVSYNGCDYQVGTLALVKNHCTFVKFGRVETIFLENDACTFLVTIFNGEYCTKFEAYALQDTNEVQFIDISSLLFHSPLYEMRSFVSTDCQKYLVLPFRDW